MTRANPRRDSLRAALVARTRYPSRSMIVGQTGNVYWPRPDEHPAPGEVLLAPYDHDGPSWDSPTLRRALDRAAQS